MSTLDAYTTCLMQAIPDLCHTYLTCCHFAVSEVKHIVESAGNPVSKFARQVFLVMQHRIVVRTMQELTVRLCDSVHLL